jgi:AcrR family transcriptional regulator
MSKDVQSKEGASRSTIEKPAGLRDLAKSDRLARIRNAAADLLKERDFNDVTTRDIARRAGVGEATLFRYIENKQDLLMMVYGDQLDDILNRIEEDDVLFVGRRVGFPVTGQSVLERILLVYRNRCNFYLINPHNAALYLREGFEAGGEISARHVAQGDRTIRQVTSILVQGQRAGVIRADVDTLLVAQNCHGIYMHEIDRTPVRGFDPETIWTRLEPRLDVQISPLII